ncbi:MAG: CIA30 family protein [Candidatus Sericytochromatia bacterium]|nr:CIA30 family protein [Candidatus Sericytochromatia bacterium]
MSPIRATLLLPLLLIPSAGLWLPTPAEAAPPMLLDDFDTLDARSALGTTWQGFSDTVMGGRSTFRLTFEPVRGKPALRLRGEVSLENRGGFIQAALPLAAGGALDASGYQGVRVIVSGRPGSYAIHLRTSDHRLPWQHHAAPLPVTPGWQTVDVPFSRFEGSGWGVGRLDPRKLQRLGLVASKQAFLADLAVAHLSLY